MALRDKKRTAAALALVSSLALTTVGCGGSSPKIAATTNPLPKPGLSRCATLIAQREHLSRASARSACNHAANAHWYHWKVTNEGNRFVYAYCSATAYDANGRKLWTEPLSPLGIPWSVGLKAGASYSLTWFMPVAKDTSLPGEVARYTPVCRTTKTPLS